MLRVLKPLFHPLFIIAIGLYLLLRLCRRYAVDIPIIINSHLADLVCMPIILTLCLVGVRLQKKEFKLELTGIQIFGMTLFYSLLFELILPNVGSSYIGDFGDVVAYFIGAVCYYLVFRRSH